MSFERKNRVFIGGITEDIRKEEIEKEFGKYGKLNSVWVAQNPVCFPTSPSSCAIHSSYLS
jgi:RNA recognition motif-containing protein